VSRCLLQTRALQCLGRYDEAATLLRELCQRDAGDLEARCRLGELLYDAGQRAAAQQQWQAVVKAKRPQDGLQLAFLGRAHWHSAARTTSKRPARRWSSR